jgi:hypothetical protein
VKRTGVEQFLFSTKSFRLALGGLNCGGILTVTLGVLNFSA